MFFKPRVIGKFLSDYSGTIRIVQGWGFRHLSTEKIQQSGGIVKEIWTKALKNKTQKNKSWLVLGVAGGTVIKMISQKFSPQRIVGVDIDPVIVEAGRKYFGLSEIPKSQIIISDADSYLQKTKDKFDYILVDLFGVEGPPPFVYSEKFLKRLKQVGTKIFFNHLYNTPENIQKAQQLTESFQTLGFPAHLQRVLANAVIIC